MHYYKLKNEEEADVPGGIGEEDFLTLVLPERFLLFPKMNCLLERGDEYGEN